MAKVQDFALNTVLSLQTKEFQAGVASANAQMANMKRKVTTTNDSMTASFKKFGASLLPVISVAAAGTAIISFGKSSVEAAEKSEISNKRLLKVLNGNVSAFNDLTRYADQLRLKTGVSGSSIKQIEMLAVGAGYGTDKVKKLVSASIELSSVTGKDLQASYMMLNKTLSGSAGRLAMVDPAFKSLTKTQLMNGAGIDLIISKYGGIAEISATSAQKLSSDWAKFQVSQGKSLLVAKNGFLDFADAIVRGITPTRDITREMESEKQKVNSLATALQDQNLPLAIRRDYLIQLNQIAPEVVKNQSAEKLNYDKLTISLKEYNKQTVNRILLERQSAKLAVSVNRGVDIKEELESKNTQLGTLVTKYLSVDNRLNKDIKDQLTAKFNKDHDLAAYAQGLSENVKSEIKKKTPDYKGSNGASLKLIEDIKILTHAFNANQSLVAAWQKANANFSQKNGLNVDPIKTGGDKPGGNGSDKEKVTTINDINDLVLKITKEYNDKFRKEDIQVKRDELELLYNTEKEKILSFKATSKAQKDIQDQALRDLENSTNRQRTALSITPMEAKQSNGVTTQNKLGGLGLSPMAKATKDALEFGKTMSVVKGITNDALSSIGDSMGSFSSMFGEQTAAFKAFATTQAVINTYLAAAQVMANPLMLDPFSKGLAMAATISMGLANVAKINGVKFAEGGIVPGASFSGDRVHAMVNSGEMILNKSQQGNMFSMLNSGATSMSGGTVKFEIEGSKLVGVIANHNRRQSKIR